MKSALQLFMCFLLAVSLAKEVYGGQTMVIKSGGARTQDPTHVITACVAEPPNAEELASWLEMQSQTMRGLAAGLRARLAAFAEPRRNVSGAAGAVAGASAALQGVVGERSSCDIYREWVTKHNMTRPQHLTAE